MNRRSIVLASLLAAFLTGCGQELTEQESHLVIRAHGAGFDIVDPSGNIVETLSSAESVLAAFQDPAVLALISDGTVVIRCRLDSQNLPTGEAAELAAKVGSITGVRSVRWEQDRQTNAN